MRTKIYQAGARVSSRIAMFTLSTALLPRYSLRRRFPPISPRPAPCAPCASGNEIAKVGATRRSSPGSWPIRRLRTRSSTRSSPAGVLYTDPGAEVALLLAFRLPPLPPDRRYQVWLFTQDGVRAGGDSFAPGAEGNSQILLRAPASFARYRAVGVSAESPGDGESPSAP